MITKPRFLVVVILFFVMCVATSNGWLVEDPADEILFGMSTALTGPAAQLGMNMQAGVDAAFAEANRTGGIHGRFLRLITLDDGYEPRRTAPNMHQLIGEHNVVGVIGNVGTPTAVTAVPIANQHKTVLFGAYTGAGVLRKSPPDRYVINYRASYAEETAAMVDALINNAGIKVEEIGFFTQRDAYGDAGYFGGVAALKRHGLESDNMVAHGRYERNTDAVENGLADIIASKTPVRAVIMVGAYQPCATFIKLARQFELDALFLNVSFVGSTPLANALGVAGDGVIVTQVVPHFEMDLPIAIEYREAMSANNQDAPFTFGALEGYIAGRILIAALERIDKTPTREAVVTALEDLGRFDIGIGHALEIRRDDHQASHKVWPSIIRNGKIVPFDWSELNTRLSNIDQ